MRNTFFTACAATVLCACPVVFAQDECVTAPTLVAGVATAFNTTTATATALPAVTDALCTGTFLNWTTTTKDVWFKWTATEAGSATFSTCFGAPFMPRHPSVYGELLKRLIAEHGVDCWLVNTGWTGGKHGVGRRMPIRVTRRLLTAALDGSLNRADFRTDPYFGFAVPTSVPGVEPHILYPVKTWASKAEFAETAKKLVAMFRDNFAKFEQHVDADVSAAAPASQLAAE
jgi:hypothetical protein